jgi:hypothetical protein
MIAYYTPRADKTEAPKKRQALSHDLLHGMSPKEFDDEAKALADADAMTPAVRARIKAQLIERLKTPVDQPSWGPDWVRQGERAAAQARKGKGVVGKILAFSGKKKAEDEAPKGPLSEEEADDAAVISRNMEKSRQVSHYKPLYAVAVVVALAILLVAMFVDYHIIREVWTRALSNEFMVVPASLKSSVVFKSLQVIFAVLIVHFMLKITGAYGRNTMIVAAFVMADDRRAWLSGRLQQHGGGHFDDHGATPGTGPVDKFDRRAFRLQRRGAERHADPPGAAGCERRGDRRHLAWASQTVTIVSGRRRFLVLACLRQRDILHRDNCGGALYADRREQCAQFPYLGRLQASAQAVRTASPA